MRVRVGPADIFKTQTHIYIAVSESFLPPYVLPLCDTCDVPVSPSPPRLSPKTSFGMRWAFHGMRNIPWSSSHQWLLVSIVRIKEMNDLWRISDFFLSFLCSYLQSYTPRRYASQPAILSRAGGGAFSSNQQGFLKPVKATDERVHASKCSGEHKLCASCPSCCYPPRAFFTWRHTQISTLKKSGCGGVQTHMHPCRVAQTHTHT